MNDTLSFVTKHSDTIGIVFDGLVAIGTILLALLAIYGERVKKWLFRPNLKIQVDNKEPFVDTIENKNAVSKDVSIIENTTSIRVKIENTGKTTALKCQALVEKVWCKHQTNENFFPKVTITPSQLDWHNASKVLDITPHIPAYIELARIELTEVRTMEEGDSRRPNKQSADLYLSIVAKGKKGLYVKLGKGTFIIPLILYSDNLNKTIQTYIEIFWNGTDAKKLTASDFYIKMKDEKDVNKEIKQ